MTATAREMRDEEEVKKLSLGGMFLLEQAEVSNGDGSGEDEGMSGVGEVELPRDVVDWIGDYAVDVKSVSLFPPHSATPLITFTRLTSFPLPDRPNLPLSHPPARAPPNSNTRPPSTPPLTSKGSSSSPVLVRRLTSPVRRRGGGGGLG